MVIMLGFMHIPMSFLFLFTHFSMQFLQNSLSLHGKMHFIVIQPVQNEIGLTLRIARK